MIAANELRLGNLVYNENGQIVSVSATRVVLCDDRRVIYEPIPLTEEWLLKLGFDENQDLLVRGLIMRYSFSSQTIELIRYETLIDFEIKHVHTLQNLYFALTGEELTLKES